MLHVESIGPIITKPIHNPNVRIMSGPHRVVVVSFALMLYYTLNIQALGMKEIWLQNGTRGALWHMLPLHQSVSHLGAPLAKTVIKAHMPWRQEMTAWAR